MLKDVVFEETHDNAMNATPHSASSENIESTTNSGSNSGSGSNTGGGSNAGDNTGDNNGGDNNGGGTDPDYGDIGNGD